MVRSRPFRRLLTALSLCALLMLTLAPTVSRLRVQGERDGWVALCTVNGLRWIAVADFGTPTKHVGHDGDCDYCPLLATTVAPPVMAWAPPPPSLPLAPSRRPAAIETISAPVFPGCPSQGPPLPA